MVDFRRLTYANSEKNLISSKCVGGIRILTSCVRIQRQISRRIACVVLELQKPCIDFTAFFDNAHAIFIFTLKVGKIDKNYNHTYRSTRNSALDSNIKFKFLFRPSILIKSRCLKFAWADYRKFLCHWKENKWSVYCIYLTYIEIIKCHPLFNLKRRPATLKIPVELWAP